MRSLIITLITGAIWVLDMLLRLPNTAVYQLTEWREQHLRHHECDLGD